LVFIAGQITVWNGELKHLGKVGQDLSVEEGKEAAKICALNIVAQLREAAGGDLDRVKRIVRLGGFVNSTPDFTQQPEVVNGASDLIVEIFGEAGKHARAAVSAGALPRNVSVEIEAVAELA
jgi:enamine deaminase RidA (YjgF/YER057c/UK114 family)